MRNAPRTIGKAAVAAGSAALLFGSFGATSFGAGPNRPADSPVCGALGGVAAPVGQICTTAVDALPLPAVPVDLPTGGTGSALPALPDLGSIPPTGGAAGLPDLGGLLPTSGLPDPGGLLPTAGLPGLPTGGDSAPLPGLPATPGLPGVDPAPGGVATVVGVVDPLVGSLPTGSLPPDALPIGAAPGAVAPVVGPALGAVNTFGGIAGTALPVTKPIVNPLLTTVNAAPGQVSGLLNTALGGSPVATIPALAGFSLSPAAPTVETGRALARPPAEASAELPVNLPITGVSRAAASSASGGGESLPITGIGVAGLGLAGAAALGWGAFARSISARRKLVSES